jgi:zinc protease
MAYRAPAADDPDFVPALVLATLLGGPLSLAFGGGGANRSSRLYRALVETELAVDVDCSVEATLDPYLLDISAVLRAGRSHEEAEAAIDRVIAEVAGNAVGAAELAKGKKQVMAQFAFGNERITGRAMMLAMAHMVFTPEFLNAFAERVAAVGPQDVQRVAQRLFPKKNRVVGWYVPQDDSDERAGGAELA